jgi:phosphohistidine swiveling domain-containing protein
VIIKGTAGSPGILSDFASVVTNLEDARRQKSGGVIVTDRVGPEWLDVLVRCSAVVTRYGGVASHAATLCRELKRPSVVGIEDAIEGIKAGDLLLVDGDQGTVSIVEQESKKNESR